MENSGSQVHFFAGAEAPVPVLFINTPESVSSGWIQSVSYWFHSGIKKSCLHSQVKRVFFKSLWSQEFVLCAVMKVRIQVL